MPISCRNGIICDSIIARTTMRSGEAIATSPETGAAGPSFKAF